MILIWIDGYDSLKSATKWKSMDLSLNRYSDISLYHPQTTNADWKKNQPQGAGTSTPTG